MDLFRDTINVKWNRLATLLLMLAALLIAGAPAEAQCGDILPGARLTLLPGAQVSKAVPSQVAIHGAFVTKKPIIAEMTCQITSVTPWGVFTQTYTIKFWRTGSGVTRQDTAYNTTTIEDHDYNVHLDHESKDINLDHESKTATVKRLGFSLLPTIGQVGQPIKGIIGGRAVTGVRSAGFSPGRHSSSCEDWIADDLRVLVHSECKFEDGSGILQQMHNIEEREPDPALFRIPEGYSVVTCETQHANPDEPHVNPPWHCRQEKSGEKKR